MHVQGRLSTLSWQRLPPAAQMYRVRGALGLAPSYSKAGLSNFFYTHWSTYIFIGSAGLGCSTVRVSTKLVLQSQSRLDELLFAHL